jgi:peptidoglycan/xylan/chitin deacetylase (PgdA/CDA1 family)
MMHARIFAALSLLTIFGVSLTSCGGGGDSGGVAGNLGGDIAATAVSTACDSATNCLTAQRVTIATYRGNRSGAVSYTFDDGSAKCDQIIQLFDANNLKASFYLIAKFVSSAQWIQWLAASHEGHEIGSHSSTHLYLFDPKLTDAQVYSEIVDSQKIIADHIGIKPDIFVFPGNANDARSLALFKQYYLATRFPVEMNGPDYNISYIGTPSTSAQMNAALDAAVAKGKWTAFAGHSIDGAGYNPISSTVLRDNLAYAASLKNVLWVDTFANVARYKHCRELAHIKTTALSASEGSIEISTGDPAMCNFPLTLVISDVTTASTRTILSSVPVSRVSNQVVLDVVPGQPARLTFN